MKDPANAPSLVLDWGRVLTPHVSPEARRRASITVCECAATRQEAAELLAMLGLDSESEPVPVRTQPAESRLALPHRGPVTLR